MSRGAEAGARPGAARVLIAAGIGLVAFWLTFSLVRPDPDLVEGAPPDIMGVWATDDERYADRGFEIVPGEFRLQVGSHWADVRAYPVREVRVREVPGGTEYEIRYATHEGDAVHTMTVDSAGVARLPNPSDVRWSRR